MVSSSARASSERPFYALHADDQERQSAIRSLVRSLAPGGSLFLDVRAEPGSLQRASRERADGKPRSRQVDRGDGVELVFTTRTTWSQGMLHVEEQYDLVRPGTPTQRSSYFFTMRPWTEAELRTVLHDSGLRDVEISAGVGRRTADRFFVVAS